MKLEIRSKTDLIKINYIKLHIDANFIFLDLKLYI